jgi:hypothetical protein
MMTETIKPQPAAYMCRRGVSQSAARLTREPTAAEWAKLAELGFERARVGQHYRRNIVCPVNGDGYWHTRCELLDADGVVVGTAEVDQGPRGQI